MGKLFGILIICIAAFAGQYYLFDQDRSEWISQTEHVKQELQNVQVKLEYADKKSEQLSQQVNTLLDQNSLLQDKSASVQKQNERMRLHRQVVEELRAQIVQQNIEKLDLLAELSEHKTQLATLDKTKKTYARVHYFRPNADYYGWGVHATGLAVTLSTSWNDPIRFKYLDEYGAYAKVRLHEDYKENLFSFQIHNGPDIDCDPSPNHGTMNATKEILSANLEGQLHIWLVSGVPRIFTSKDEALEKIKELNLPHPLLNNVI